MTTAIVTHPACMEHDPGPGHPEAPARLAAVLAALDAPEFAGLLRLEAPRATIAQLAACHPRGHVEALLAAAPKSGFQAIDADTIVSPGSREAALRAAGAVVAAIDALMAGSAGNAFCPVRPPGHHAEPGRAMGFCLFNNVAVGARHALDHHGLARVAIADFDVHHGNGSQAIAAGDGRITYASTHQSPLYPGTGAAEFTGEHGNIVNAPLPPNAGSAEFRAAMERHILPAISRARPELVLVSAGFDGHAADPLAQLNLQIEDYVWITEALLGVARRFARGRLVSALEGGYNLRALADSAAAHVRTLMKARG